MDDLGLVLEEVMAIFASVDWNAVGNNFATTVYNTLQSYGIYPANVPSLGNMAATVGVAVFVLCIVLMAVCIFAFVCFATIFIALLVLLFLQEYLLPAIALYKMAKKAGYRYPWFAFIPIMQTFLEYVLPKKEFRVFFIRATFEYRYVVAIVAIGLSTFGVAVDQYLGYIPVVGAALSFALGLFIAVFLIGCRWRKMHDLIRTYENEKKALAISIISLFIPLVHTIALLALMNREPDFGAGNYYAPEKNECAYQEIVEETKPENAAN
ncbi:MAG: hypothetical protein IKO32_06565 [Lachnospiraceae bacterium]|nr:hypothetical protein [Lachnospiraceae bacterium]